MIGGENSNNDDNSGATYLTEDILIIILHCLPIASCIARFRCVCRSWRTLLSDPNFIRKIIVSQTSAIQQSLQVLITGNRDAEDRSPLLYSVYSYETLSPIPGYEESAELLSTGIYVPEVVGCCGGIICLTIDEETADGRYVNNILLWNPATSESKFIPPGPFHPDAGDYHREQRIGFGYDPRTQDYKVVRVLEFDDVDAADVDAAAVDMYEFDPANYYNGPPAIVFAEVYSLKNDSWNTLNPSNEQHYSRSRTYHITKYVNQHLSTYRNEKCYWFRYEGSEEACVIVSFDMSTEVFERVTFPQPAGLTYHGVDPVRKTELWCLMSCFMLKNEVLMVTFRCQCPECFSFKTLYGEKWARNTSYGEKWVLLKHGVAESWTKLRAFMSSYDIQLKEDWNDDIQQKEVWEDDAYICVDIATGEAIRKIETELKNVAACVFAPTRVPMSQLVDSKSE